MKRKTASRSLQEVIHHKALLSALSDDLALPLLQIKTSLELIGQSDSDTNNTGKHISSMSLSADAGLQLIEAYRLGLHVNQNIETELEPVAVGAILQDVASQLEPYAKQYHTDLEVDVQGRLTPVLAHPESLFAALQCLGASMIRAQAAQDHKSRYRLILGAHKTADNIITAGAFSNVKGLSDRTLRAARHLVGKARQPLPEVPSGAASGVLIADMLCSAMWQPLRAAAHKNMGGLATGVPQAKQLQIV